MTLPEQMEPIAVPASYNDQKDDIAYRNHYGYAYYRRNITVPSYYKGQRLVLRFDAVTHFAKIYLNGVLLTQHKGGFLPFEVDITDKLCAGESQNWSLLWITALITAHFRLEMRREPHLWEQTM